MTELVLSGAGALWRGLRASDRVWLLLLAIPLALLALDAEAAPRVLSTAVRAFAGTLPYVVLAVLLIALLRATGSEGVVGRAFAGHEGRMIVLAALVGGLAPFCSCEVIPFIAALLAAGTPLSAVMAFWLSSPLMDPPTFMVTWGALGLEYAVGKVVAAVAIGLAGGFAMRALTAGGAFGAALREAPGRGGCCGRKRPVGAPVWRFWEETERRRVFARTALEQTLFLTKWLGLAYLLEGLMIEYVPADLIAGLVGGDGPGSIVVAALVGAPAYLNGYAAPALVAGLLEQGMSAGAGMAFMVAGAVSSIPAMAAVWALVRPPVFATYVAFGLSGAVLSGLAFAAAMAALGGA